MTNDLDFFHIVSITDSSSLYSNTRMCQYFLYPKLGHKKILKIFLQKTFQVTHDYRHKVEIDVILIEIQQKFSSSINQDISTLS